MNIQIEKCTLTEKERNALIHIRRGYAKSRAEVARCLRISRPTSSTIIEKLIGLHAIRETGVVKASRGKAPMILAPEAEFQYSIGLDLSYRKQLVGVLLDGRNMIVNKAEAAYDNTSLESIREASLEMMEKLAGSHTICGLGVAVTGIVNPKGCEILKSVNPVIASNPIRNLFMDWTKLHVRVVNHPRAAQFSEFVGGAADNKKDLMLFSLGETIGNAFAYEGILCLGASGAAGEIQNLRLADGRTLGKALDREVVPSYSEDELVAICADGFGQLMDILDLKHVILSGRFTEFGAGFLKKLNMALSNDRESNVIFSKFGKFGAARGCAIHIAERVLASENMI